MTAKTIDSQSVFCRRVTLWLSLVPCFCGVSAQRFLPDDPIRVDDDRIPVEKPAAVELSRMEDYLRNSHLWRPTEGEEIGPAENMNTLGEVPDSSWFTNRIGKVAMTLEELSIGPNRSEPGPTPPWMVIRGKQEGVSPGFTIRDAHGDMYFVKFDPPEYPQLATSTEVIATKFFHAFGYNVPQNYLVSIRQEDVEISPAARTIGINGRERRMAQRDLDRILAAVPQASDGTMQAMASRALSGEPIGPFQYYGTRKDDPNDIFPHQNRRELRGLRVFAAWLNHDDARAINSLDAYIRREDGGYIKHHLIDFGSCFGSGSIQLQSRRAGYEYVAELKPSIKAGLTLGWWDRPWRHIEYDIYPAVGRFEAEYFDPQEWKTEHPNATFMRMRPDDALWATGIVAEFTDEMIRAIVGSGRIRDPRASEYLATTLIKRRDKVISHYLSRLNPLTSFRIDNGSKGPRLLFRNLGSEFGLSRKESYRYQWFRFDNQNQSLEPLGQTQNSSEPGLVIPPDRAEFLMVRINTISPQQEAWLKKVDIFIRNGAQKSVVGIERGL